MNLRDLLYFLKEDADVCLKESDLKVTLGEASELLINYTEDEDTYVQEIEPDGYVDSDGISYLTIYIAQREENVQTTQSDIDTIYKGFDTRYIYRGSSIEHTGTIYTNLQDGTIGKCHLYEDRTIQEVLESKNKDFGQIIFWILWILFIVVVTYGFYYLDNSWLR